MVNNKQCTYPNCDSCNYIFSIPVCMLVDAGIDLYDDIIIIPYEGYVLIRQDEGGVCE